MALRSVVVVVALLAKWCVCSDVTIFEKDWRTVQRTWVFANFDDESQSVESFLGLLEQLPTDPFWASARDLRRRVETLLASARCLRMTTPSDETSDAVLRSNAETFFLETKGYWIEFLHPDQDARVDGGLVKVTTMLSIPPKCWRIDDTPETTCSTDGRPRRAARVDGTRTFALRERLCQRPLGIRGDGEV